MIPIADQIKFIQGEAAFTLYLTINSTGKEAAELNDKMKHLEAVLDTLRELERDRAKQPEPPKEPGVTEL